MTTLRKPFKKSALAIAAMLVVGVAPTQEAFGASCTWNLTSGNWNVAGDWSCGVVPTGPAGDSATINAGKTVTVNDAQSIWNLLNAGSINIDNSTFTLWSGGLTTNTGTINVGSNVGATMQIQGGYTINNTGGVINIAPASFVYQTGGSTIRGGTINALGGTLVASNSVTNFLDGVTFSGNGVLDMDTGTGIERIVNGLTLNAAIHVNSNSILAFQGDQTISGTGTITLGGTGASNRINTEAGNLTLGSGITINGKNGTIGGQSFVSGPATLTNNGTISASVAAGQVNLSITGNGLTTNKGVLSAQNGGNLLLSSVVTNAGSGHIDAIGANSVVTQNGITISGGTLNTSGGGTFVATNNGANRLAGVTLSGTLDLASNTGLELVTGNLAFGTGGVVNINSNSAFGLQADTLSGSGTINFGSTGANNRLTIEAGDSVIGSGVLVHGQNGTIGGQVFVGGAATLTNNGTISADVSGGTITLGVNGTVTNNGTLSALNGGTLVLNNSINGAPGSSIVVGAGSTLLQNGVTLNGIINSSGAGNFLVSNSVANTLNAVTFSGNLNLASSTSLERALNGLTLTPGSGISINNNSVFGLQSETLGGSGTVTFGNTGASNRLTVEAGDSIIGAGILVHGQNGTIGGQVYAGGTATLTNNGTISADVAGGTISIGVNSSAANAVTNNGVLSALNGGTLVLNSNVTGNSGSFINVGAGSRVFQNGVTLSGVINNAGTGSFQAANSGSNTLNAVTFTGPLDLATGTSLERALNGLTFGTGSTVSINNNSVLAFQNEEIGGTAVITLGNTGASNRVTIEAGATVLDSGITIQGQNGTVGTQAYAGGAATLANAGVIKANVDQGTINLNVNGLTTNTGTLAAQNGGTLVLNSAVTNAGSGHIDALGGGTAGSLVLQNGIVITGGTLNTSGAGTIAASNSGGNVLSGVTLAGILDLASGTAQEQIQGGSLVLSVGAVNINSNSILALEGTTLSGTGTITFGGTGASNRLNVEAGDSVIGSGVTVHGQNGTIGNQSFNGGAATLTNNGVITADTGGGLITLSVNGLTTNNATMSARGGSSLLLNSAVTNAGSGHIDAIGTNSVVVQNGVTITGGALNTSGGGVIAASNSGNNFLANTTLAGTLDLASATGQERLVNTTVTLGTGGVVNINNNSILDLQASTINGNGTINLGNSGASNRIAIEAGSSTIGSGVTVQGQNGTLGNQLYLGGLATLTNNGTISANVAGGTINLINASYVNNGTFSATAGVLSANTGFTGTGTALTSGTGQLIVGAASTVGSLLNNGTTATALSLGTNNITVSSDYNNANFGTGNAFNARANVAGTGQILAGGNAAQAITGTGVTNGNTANATLTLGNVRVGSTTFDYQVANTGSSGPSLRGAIQTSVNGANLTDARLSGTGVTASNYNTGGPGSNTGDLGVTFTVANSGLIAPLTGQVLNLRSNFGNIPDQKLNIVLGSGATAYNAAVGNASSPVQLANQRIGGSNSAVLTVANTAPSGSFSEDLNASFGGATGAATGSGSILGRLAGTSNTGSGAITVGVDTSVAGARTGGVTLNYQTTGTVNGVSNGLGVASVGSQVVTVNGNVFQAASGAIQTAALNFGTVQVGQSVSQNLVIRNTAVGANGFVEDLNASFGSSNGTGSGLISGSGSLSGILAGTNSTAVNGLMTVAVNTANAGVINGGIAVNYFTAGTVNGVSNGLGSAAVGSQNYGVAGTIEAIGNVINQASPLVNNPAINFGAMRVGDASPTANVSVTNVATTAPQAALNASISSNGGPVIASGSFNLLAPGNTSTNQLTVGLNTSVAGNYTGGNAGSATIALVSDASNVGNCAPNCQLDLAPQLVSVSGKVYTPAVAQLNTTSVDFGIVHRGDVVSLRDVSVSNAALATAANDTLRGSAGSVSSPFIAAGSFADLAAQGTAGSALQVGLNTAVAGVFTGTASANFASHDADLADLALGSQTIALTGQVNNYAAVALTKTGEGQMSVVNHTYTLDFGTVLLGSGEHSASLSVLNAAIGPADLLSGNFDLTGLGPDFTLSGFGSFADLVAGGSFGGLDVLFASDVQGAFLSTIVLHGTGSNASGFIGQLDDTTLVLRGDVNVVAVPEPGTYVMMFAGLLVVVGASKSRRRQAAARAA